MSCVAIRTTVVSIRVRVSICTSVVCSYQYASVYQDMRCDCHQYASMYQNQYAPRSYQYVCVLSNAPRPYQFQYASVHQYDMHCGHINMRISMYQTHCAAVSIRVHVLNAPRPIVSIRVCVSISTAATAVVSIARERVSINNSHRTQMCINTHPGRSNTPARINMPLYQHASQLY
jgi:hypothetical protein